MPSRTPGWGCENVLFRPSPNQPHLYDEITRSTPFSSKSRQTIAVSNSIIRWRLIPFQGNPHYIVDVSHQGIKVNRIASRTRYAGEPFPNYKGKMVDPKELSLEDDEFPPRGCEHRCCGINFYCDYNWREGRYR